VTPGIQRITLTRSVESADGERAFAYPGTELWWVEWTVLSRGKHYTHRHSHFTEGAARRHVHGLLQRRPTGTAVEDVFED
jgi:hypothetical protein